MHHLPTYSSIGNHSLVIVSESEPCQIAYTIPLSFKRLFLHWSLNRVWDIIGLLLSRDGQISPKYQGDHAITKYNLQIDQPFYFSAQSSVVMCVVKLKFHSRYKTKIFTIKVDLLYYYSMEIFLAIYINIQTYSRDLTD